MLMETRGISNVMQEKFLDFEGWPRPPGWHSFSYKDIIHVRDVTHP